MAGHSGPWGFHELSRRWAARLVHSAHIRAGDLVLDVGAGTGVITEELLRVGASVVAVELHRGRADLLRWRFAGHNVTVVCADAADLRVPRRPFTVVANPPFNITTALLRRLTHPTSELVSAAVVLPAWATMRWAGGRGVGGTTSKCLFHFAAGPTIPAHAFHPPPSRAPRILLINRTER